MKERSFKIALGVTWALVVLILLGVGFSLLREFVLAPEQAVSLFPAPASPRLENREITLYFADENAAMLIPEKRRIGIGVGISADAAKIIAELIKGPQFPGFFPTIPGETRLLNSYAFDGTLVLDFTHELQTSHPGGSAGEILTVYSIVNTITENLESIKKVQILVEGEEVETLMGHLDLTRPLAPDKKWTTASPQTMQGI